MFNGSREVRDRLEALEGKHKALEEDHDKLRRHVDLEWEELKDKVHRWMQRTGARDRAEAKALGTARGVDTWQGTADPISAQLLARRSRGAPVRSVPPLGEEGDEGTGS